MAMLRESRGSGLLRRLSAGHRMLAIVAVVAMAASGLATEVLRTTQPPDVRVSVSVSVPERTEVSAPAPAYLEAPPAQQPPDPGRVDGESRVALLVGINEAPGTPPLRGSHTDVELAYEALRGYGFRSKDIKILLEGQATRDAILGELRSLAARSTDDGIAVFVIATHTRREGGRNRLETHDGGGIAATELADLLGRVRGKMWVALPTCYAEGYALPGVVGPGRVATFASPAGKVTYQLGSAGSYLMIYMVREAMLGGKAPASVQSAFQYAYDDLAQRRPDRVPVISDGVEGDLVLGPAPWKAPKEPPPEEVAEPAPPPPPDPGEEEDANQRRGVPVGVCGKYRYNC